MSLKRKMGIVMFLCCMAAVAAVVWYLLLAKGRSSTQFNGTFVTLPDVEIVRAAA